jgi:hypothetical protein
VASAYPHTPQIEGNYIVAACPDSTSDSTPRFKHGNVDTVVHKVQCRSEAGVARPNDDDSHLFLNLHADTS